jgi:hypothetical protein
MNKTSSQIQIVDVTNTQYSVNSIVVRPPAFLKVFRCTIYFQVTTEEIGFGYLSAQPNGNNLNSLIFSNFKKIETNNRPGTDFLSGAIDQLILDRRGVGYMQDNFYVSSSTAVGSQFVFIWEGETAE